jgi:hypothetical protein
MKVFNLRGLKLESTHTLLHICLGSFDRGIMKHTNHLIIGSGILEY